MAEVRTYPFVRHFRAEPTADVLRYRRGELIAEGPGLAFFFAPRVTQAAEIPLDDQELPFLFHARSADFQALTVQGVITYRFVEPRRTAGRIDFTVDLHSGRWTAAPLEQITGQLTQLAQQFVIDEMVATDLRDPGRRGRANSRQYRRRPGRGRRPGCTRNRDSRCEGGGRCPGRRRREGASAAHARSHSA